MKTILLISMLLFNAIIIQAQHRKHVLGMTFCTYPPIYSCEYCGSEISPNSLLPYKYDTMRVPMIFGRGKNSKDTLWWNGYGRFCKFLKDHHWNEDSFFLAKWNERDTSCISREIALHKSENIGDHWFKTHKPGIYWLNKEDWMSTKGFMGHKSKTSNYAMGGRFSDAVLLADKWYKIDSDLTSPLIK